MSVAGVSAAREAQTLLGRNPAEVIAAIKARRARQAAGNFRGDGRKLALVIEGGAMRAVSSAGGAVVLAQLGLSDVFDEVYATSAAVMNASYFITNQPLLGISVYFDHCTTRAFVDLRRFWKVIDVDYIFDHVAVHEKPLDTAKLLAARSRLYVAVMDRQTGDAFMVDTKTVRTPVLQVLKASAAIPVFYNRSVDVDGRPCMDGGLAIPIAVRQALDNSCTDVLVLSTRPPSYINSAPGWWNRQMFNLICARGNAAVNRVFAERHLRSREARDLALGRDGSAHGANVATICPSPDENIQRMTTNRAALHAAAESYGRRTLRAFGGDANQWTLPKDCASAARTTPAATLEV
jgi:predicted patatin/cPLA2 family phospholipase